MALLKITYLPRLTRIGQKVAGCARPGHPEKKVSESLVREWIEEVRQAGYRNIVCLLNDEQLNYYTFGNGENWG